LYLPRGEKECSHGYLRRTKPRALSLRVGGMGPLGKKRRGKKKRVAPTEIKKKKKRACPTGFVQQRGKGGGKSRLILIECKKK